MRRLLLTSQLVAFAAISFAHADPVAECDRLAAAVSDVEKPASVNGVALDAIDAARAVPACEAAVEAKLDDRRLAFQLGRAIDAAGDPVRAMAFYEKAAEAGHGIAAYNAGIGYMLGNGVAASQERARAHFERSHALGYREAGTNLAYMMSEGEGGPADPVGARKLYADIAAAGDVDAMNNLASMLRSGEGGPVDDAGARLLYEKAVESGQLFAVVGLAEMLRAGEGGPADPPRARALLESAVSDGFRDAVLPLADMLSRGEGGAVEGDRALALLDRDDAVGDVDATLAFARDRSANEAAMAATLVVDTLRTVDEGEATRLIAAAAAMPDPLRAALLRELSKEGMSQRDVATALRLFYAAKGRSAGG